MDAWNAKWSELPEDAPMDRLRRRRVIGEQAMISEVRLAKGCDVPTHSHPNEQMAMLISGKMRFGIGAEGSADRREVVIGAGEVLVLPGGVPHSAYALEDSLIYDIFSPPSEKTGIDRH
ncbi:MAG: cupin domain-containing protein [Phycisphaeraceae bacterium]|nr:cupin domain-containing protein [Phycisphaeraceae bacterium]